jgi:hypothetical protein
MILQNVSLFAVSSICCFPAFATLKTNTLPNGFTGVVANNNSGEGSVLLIRDSKFKIRD